MSDTIGSQTMRNYPDNRAGISGGGNFHMRCGKQHRSTRAVARCCWGPDVRVNGDGRFAAIFSGPRPRVLLFETEADARQVVAAGHPVFVLRLESDTDDGLYRHAAHP